MELINQMLLNPSNTLEISATIGQINGRNNRLRLTPTEKRKKIDGETDGLMKKLEY